MLEQEIASAIKFILKSAGDPSPYYYEVPQDFLVPAAYFPSPEIVSGGDTLLTYSLRYSWFIKFFHKDTPSAYALGLAALTALQGKKNVIPLIGEAGGPTGRGFRAKDPSLKPLDRAAQLTLMWDSPRPYDADGSQKMMVYDADLYIKAAYDGALSQINGMEG
jgi:hypothetical protein